MKPNEHVRRSFRAFVFPAAAFLFFAATAVWGQVTVTQPAAIDTVKAAPDYATEVFYDRWDMNQRTDLGWWIYDKVDAGAKPYLANPTFAGGIFSATTEVTDTVNNRSDAQIWLVDTDFPNASHIGKFGSNYKIDADKYTVFAIRMYVPSNSYGNLFWSQNTIYNGQTASGTFNVLGGWNIYLVSIPNLGISDPKAAEGWSGLKDSLRFDPTSIPNELIKIDWVRLVQTGSAYNRTISGTGDANTPSVDIYLDDNTDPADGNLGLLAQNVQGTPTNGFYSYFYSFLAGGLAAGNYYAVMVATGGDPSTAGVYSPGYYQVTEEPIVVLAKPSAEGSDQDFMTVASGNPWDFDALSDVDYTLHVNNATIKSNFTYEDVAGNVHSGNNVYDAFAEVQSDPTKVGDPTVFFLSSAYRGKTYKIDSTRYHNLVAKMGIYGEYSAVNGSIARVMYMRTDKHTAGECVSRDILINHKAGTNPVMYKIVADLKTLPLETGTATYGWTGTIDSFRIDPHEFSDGREFFYDDVKITADWKADTSFDITWTADAPSVATVSLYYDTDQSGYDGTLIVSGLEASQGSYTWDLTSVPGGTYYIYAVVTDSLNTNKYYATGPLIVDHTVPPQIGLSRTTLNFTKIKGGKLTPAEAVALTNAGQGTMAWTAKSSAKWLSVLPLSGTGNKTLTIKIVNANNLAEGTYIGTVMVTCPGAVNSPQVINVTLTVKTAKTDAVPFGAFDGPANGSSFGASVGLAGWALDDVAMNSVKIFRKSGKTATSKTLIGKATFVAGARPDIEVAYPTYPQNYKAGWTYTLKASSLPGHGIGTFTIMAYAYDTGGHNALLGTKTLTGTGTTSAGAAPYGALDEPEEGATVSGTAVPVSGWARTSLPNDIPADGRALTVWIDGLALGHPVYDNVQAEVAVEYSDDANAARAAGAFELDTTMLADGWHTLAWSAKDSGAAVGEIGSRYIRVRNDAAAAYAEDEELDEEASPVVANAIGAARPVEDIAVIPEDLRTAVYVKRGFDDERPAETVYPEPDGTIRIEIPEMTRVAIYLDADGAREDAAAGEARVRWILKEAKNPPETARVDAYEFVCGRLRGLPIGASFDSRDGVFFWQPGPGFVGEYTFIFVTNDGGLPTRKAVRVTIVPGNR